MHMLTIAADGYKSRLDSVKVLDVLPHHTSLVTGCLLPHTTLLLILDTGWMWSAVVLRMIFIKSSGAWELLHFLTYSCLL